MASEATHVSQEPVATRQSDHDAAGDISRGADFSGAEAGLRGFALVPPYPVMPVRRFSSGSSGDELGGTEADSGVTDALRRRKGAGRPLDRANADRFGGGFGADLSDVRVHTDGEADTIARSVQSVAFTYGKDVYFTQGSYAPGTDSGDHLLAHELAHVVQGSTGRWGSAGGTGVRIGRADDPAETAADEAADQVMTVLRDGGDPADVAAAPATGPQPVARMVRRSTGVIRREDLDEGTSQGSGGWTKGVTPGGTRGGLTLGGSRQQSEPQKWVSGEMRSGPRQQPVTTERDPVKRFKTIVEEGGAPGDPAVARQRMVDLRAMLKSFKAEDRAKISQDKDLMAKGRTYVGPKEYISLLAAVGMYTPKSTKDGKKQNMHMTGAEADVFIRENMGAIPHLKPYLDEAVKAGKQGEGFIATLDQSDWNLVYAEEFPDEAIGSEDETSTNAFASTKNKDEPAILHSDRGTRSTAIHESMHRYASDAINDTWGFDFNEGVTEYFTRLLTDKNGEPASKGGPSRSNYQSNFAFVSKLIKILGSSTKSREVALAEMNFRGKTDVLKTKFMAALKKAKTTGKAAEDAWDRLNEALEDGEWADALAELP